MRFLFCVLLLAWACNRDEGTTSTQETGRVPETVETPSPAPTPAPVPAPAPAPVPVDEKTSMINAFMKLVNDHRGSLGLKPLIHVDGMGAIAERHSSDMARGIVAFGHSGFSGRCSEAREVLGSGNLCAENVAKGQKTVSAAFQSWMNSSSHRANIEGARLTHTGFGFAKSSSGTYYWTQIFLEKN